MTFIEYELAFEELVDKAANDLGQVAFTLFISYVCGRAEAMMEKSDAQADF